MHMMFWMWSVQGSMLNYAYVPNLWLHQGFCRANPRLGCHGHTINLALLQTNILYSFSVLNRTGKRFWRRVPKLWIIFGEILLLVENLTSLAPYFQIFQWHLTISYRVVPWGSAQLAHPLEWPSFWGSNQERNKAFFNIMVLEWHCTLLYHHQWGLCTDFSTHRQTFTTDWDVTAGMPWPVAHVRL